MDIVFDLFNLLDVAGTICITQTEQIRQYMLDVL